MLHPKLVSLLGRYFTALEPLGLKPVTQVRKPFVPPVGPRLAGMLREKKHDTLRFTLSRLHRDSQRGSIEAMLDILEAEERSEQWLERLWQWYRENREFHAMSALIYGLLKFAWLKRGNGTPDSLGKKRVEAFRDALEEAERLLDKALAMQPDNPDLLTARLVSARGLGLDIAEHWTRFRAVLAIDQRHYRAHLLMLENLSARWGGSDELMFKFARGRAGQMPEGDPLKALVVYAHFDARNQRRLKDKLMADDDYFAQPEVAQEVETAWQESVQSPQYKHGASSEELCNVLAAALYLAGCHDAAILALTRMDGHCLESPWLALARTAKEAGNPGWVVDRIVTELARR